MSKAIIVSIVLLAALLANGISATVSEENDAREVTYTHQGITVTPLSATVASGGTGNIRLSDSDNDDMQPTVTKDPSGRLVVAFASQPSILEQTVTLVYSADGATWTQAAEFTGEGGVLQYPSVIGIPEAGDLGLNMMDPLAEFPMVTYRMTDVTDPGTYNGIAYSWSETEDYDEITNTYVHDLLVPMFTLHNYYLSDIPGCPFIVYMLPDLNFPTEIGGNYFDGQSVLRTAPASNIDMATGQDYFYLLFEHANQTTGYSEIAFKKTVTDKELLYTAGGGPGGMDKYADIEAMPWQRYLAKGDFDAKDPSVGASGSNVVVAYMSNDNIYGDFDIKCWYSSDSGETWDVSTVAAQGQVDETYPAVFMSGNNVYCAFEKQGNLYLAQSEDGGANWGEPIQINEEDGTVVSAPRAIDIDAGGIVWVDTRNGNMDVYYESLPAPIIDVEMTGGFGVSATVSNSGMVEAEGLDWSISLSGLVFMGKETTGTIDVLAPGEEVSISSGLVFGLGPTTVTVDVGGSTKTASGFILGPLVLGL
ncbi:MAG: hypothetical protein PHU95_04265 [Candidatus Thermoplasmatota archaeon]|nr:hypothetical protein [Candidatus Thermoplasmatota archaeon]